MGYKNFYEKLDAALNEEGLGNPEVQVREPGVPHDSSEESDGDKPNPPAAETGDALKGELEVLKSKMQVLEDQQKQNGSARNRALQASNEKISELEDKVMAWGNDRDQDTTESQIAELTNAVNEVKASVAQTEDMAAGLEEVKDRLHKAEEATKASACPNCGKLVGWGHLRPIEVWPDCLSSTAGVKKCPACGYQEEVEKQ